MAITLRLRLNLLTSKSNVTVELTSMSLYQALPKRRSFVVAESHAEKVAYLLAAGPAPDLSRYSPCMV